MSSNILEIEEKSIDDAIEKACSEFGVPREKLNIEIISGESGGFLGLFSKKAKIRASLLSLDIDFSFTDKPKTKDEKIKTETRKKPEKEATTKKDVVPEKEVTQEKKIIMEKPQKQTVPASASSGANSSMLASKARDLLDGILQRMSSECKVTVTETPEKIILNIEGDNGGLLIGKRGQNLDALQYILNKAINKIDIEHKMILIDSGEYRKKREEFLLGLAEKIREKVKKTLKPVSLAHMNAHDRRVIHLVLQEDESLITKSRGEGKFRKIVILPAKAGNNKHARERK
ncbi:MAG: Jag N-terminal domain-containing protein [Deltaproteobacteria bacterium]|nr:Jag N-terminal domain-containing protein [Deltaproteobacteria bacterium]